MIYRQHYPFHKLFEKDMENLIYKELVAAPESRLGVGTGWSGPKNLLERRPADKLATFVLATLPTAWTWFRGHGYPPAVRRLRTAAPPWEVCGWGNIMSKGDQTKRHEHIDSHLGGRNTLAGVYYLLVPEGSGPIVFQYPGGPTVSIEPKEGLLILFPPDLVHHVPPNLSEFDRVSVGLNIRRAAND